MKALVIHTAWALVAVLGALGAGSIVAGAQAPGSQPDVLSALLIEVRALRGAMEQMAVAGPRVQLALGRLQLQEQRVAAIIRRLDGIRSSIVGAEREIEQKRAQLSGLENVPDPNEDQKQLAHLVAAVKADIANVAAAMQRLQADEATVLAELGAEQARWSDINRRVEELERALGSR